MEKPSFSIIIPAYNCGRYLEDCVISILDKISSCDEILLINDGSTDDSGFICENLSAHYSNVISFHTKHFGVAEARNLGIKNASQEYLLFADGDDRWPSSFMIDDLRECLVRDDSELLVLSYQIRQQCGKKEAALAIECPDVHFDNWRENQSAFLSSFYRGIMFPCWNKVFRKSIILQNGLSFHQQQMEDFRFVLDYLDRIPSVSFLPIEGYLYYKRDNDYSLTHNIHAEMIEGYNICHQRLLSLFNKEDSKTIHQIMAPQYIATINKCLKSEDRGLSHAILDKTQQNPLAQSALKMYQPVSASDRLSAFLMRSGLYNTLSHYRNIVEAIKRNHC